MAVGTAPETVEDRVERMDSHLKQFFDDQQGFISLTVENAEKRLTALVTDKVGGLEKRLTQRIEQFENKVTALFKGVDSRLSAHDHQFVGINRRLDAVDTRFAGMNRRLDAMDTRFAGIDRRLDAIQSDVDEIKRNVRLLVGRKPARPPKPRR